MKGTFKAIVKNHVLATSKDKGTPSVKFLLLCTEDVLTGEKINQFQVYWDGYLTDKAADNTIETLTKCFDWGSDDLNVFNGTGTYIDTEVVVVCDEEQYNGKTMTKAKFMNPVGAVANVAPLDSGVARSLAESMKGRILAHRQKSGAPANTEHKF